MRSFPLSRHVAKIGIVGSIILSSTLINLRLVTIPYLDLLQFLQFVFLVLSVGGMFVVYQQKQQPWIFIITTVSALFSYFFLFVLQSKSVIVITVVVLLAMLIWNIILDRIQPTQKSA